MELYHETRAFTRHLNFNQKFNNRSKAASDKVFDRTNYFWFKGSVQKRFFWHAHVICIMQFLSQEVLHDDKSFVIQRLR